jgi:glycosyltransferase involved in cell wall biosynthesis
VATFHDAIQFQFAKLLKDVLPEGMLEDERETIQQWLASGHRVVVSSLATVRAMGELFEATAERFDVVPVSGEHVADAPCEALPAEWDWVSGRFMICPANISPHKNHEVLLRGTAAWGGDVPLVLTGEATHLHLCRWHRAVTLRKVAEESGLVLGKTLMTLGYVSEGVLNSLMRRAWALVMPTLAEGGGSFPVAEALHLGVPVICSDIPVIREQMERMRASVMWFDPRDPMNLASRLRELEGDYAAIKADAEAMAPKLRRRSWADVAGEYWRLFMQAVKDGAKANGNDSRLVA